MKTGKLRLSCLAMCALVGCTTVDEPQAPESSTELAVTGLKKEGRCRQAPELLDVFIGTDGQVHLDWADNSRHEAGFEVQRKSGTDEFSAVGTTGPDVTTFVETVPPGTYTYRVELLRHAKPCHHPEHRKPCVSNEITITVAPPNPGVMSYAVASKDGETAAKIAIAGTSGVVLDKFVLSASPEEDLMQDALRLNFPFPAHGASVVGVSLYDGSVLVAGPVPVDVQGDADFTGMGFVVPKGGSKTLTVRADLKTISGGAISGDSLKVAIDTTNPDPGTFQYHGLASGQVTSTISTFSDVAETGHEKVVRKTQPTVTLSALPTSVLADGTQALARFTVTADSAGDLSLMTVSFVSGLANAAGADLGLSGFALREVGQASDIPLARVETLGACSVAGASSGACAIRLTFDGEQTIASGTSKSYELRASVTGSDPGDAISTTVPEEDFPPDEGFPNNSVFSALTGELQSGCSRFFDIASHTQFAPNWVWSDRSDPAHSDTCGVLLGADDPQASNDWTTGRLVRNLPLDPQTLSL